MNNKLQRYSTTLFPQNTGGYYRPPQFGNHLDNRIITRMRMNQLWPEEALALQWLALELRQLFPTGNIQDSYEFRATGVVILHSVPEEHVPIITRFLTEQGMFPERCIWRNQTEGYSIVNIQFRPSLVFHGWFETAFFGA